MVKVFPLIFVLLWSSAFITTKPIIDNSDPFSALAFRFLIVAIGFFLFSIYSKQKIIINQKNLTESFFSGVLFHGLYLGGVFFSISKGMPTGIAALIVTLQPILTNALSGPILDEKVSIKQWIGVFLGFIGAALVLGFDVGSSIPILGLVATIVALIAITTSTIWQKKLSNNLPLPVSNMYQALGGFTFHLLIIIFFCKTLHRFYTNFYYCNESSNFLSFIWCFYNTNVFNKKEFS
jgi:drug/metabolite transporter (DMT)-like permease